MSRKRLATLIGAIAVALTAVASFLMGGCEQFRLEAEKVHIETQKSPEIEAERPLNLDPSLY